MCLSVLRVMELRSKGHEMPGTLSKAFTCANKNSVRTEEIEAVTFNFNNNNNNMLLT